MELTSRYGDVWTLEETESGYKFYLPDHTRLGYDGDEINFIDPPGGPFISIDGLLENKKITFIEDHVKFVIIKVEEA